MRNGEMREERAGKIKNGTKKRKKKGIKKIEEILETGREEGNERQLKTRKKRKESKWKRLMEKKERK